MASSTIRCSVTDGVARITLDRPDRLNSFTDAMHAELRTALDTVEADPAARVLVLTGAGRAFCAGQDLADETVAAGNAAAGGAPDLGAAIDRNYKPLVQRLQALRMPTLCAVNGVAAGAGVSIALACDLVIAAHSASFVQAFSKIGLIPDTGGTWFLTHRVGLARALGLALLAEKLPAERAASWGLIWDCVPDDQLTATVDGLAARLAQAPTRALVETRHAMRAAMTNPLAAQLDLERDAMRELGRSADYAEGVAAFMEKRAPRYTGA